MRIISLSVKLLFPLDGILLGCHGVWQFQVVCRNALFRINFNTLVSFSTDCALVTDYVPPSPINLSNLFKVRSENFHYTYYHTKHTGSNNMFVVSNHNSLITKVSFIVPLHSVSWQCSQSSGSSTRQTKTN
jgi:hypothetical protein